MRDLDTLTEAQQARAVHVFYAFFKLWENIYLHYLTGSIDDTVWKYNSEVLFAYGSLPGSNTTHAKECQSTRRGFRIC